MASRLANVVFNAIEKQMDRLSILCGRCDKILECEEQATETGICNAEPRYCKRLITAAVLEEDIFIVPFPKEL